jgi:hypothetical protein
VKSADARDDATSQMFQTDLISKIRERSPYCMGFPDPRTKNVNKTIRELKREILKGAPYSATNNADNEIQRSEVSHVKTGGGGRELQHVESSLHVPYQERISNQVSKIKMTMNHPDNVGI